MASETSIVKAFALLAAGGKRRPKEHDDRGMVEASVAVYASILSDVSDDEVGRAVEASLRKPDPWWPTPGELRELVPGMVESEDEWKRLEKMPEHIKRYKDVHNGNPYRDVPSRETWKLVIEHGGREAVRRDGGARLRHAIRGKVAPLQLVGRLVPAALEDKAS